MPKGQKRQKVKALIPSYTMRVGEARGPGEIDTRRVRLGRNEVHNEKWLGTSKGKPCPTARKGCPLQLVFKDGVPYLRMCHAQKQAGRLVPAGSPTEAYRRGKELCACWEREGRSFDRCAAPDAPLGRGRRSR